MSGCELDHLVVVAGSREAGTAWVEAALGVPLQVGGEHDRMGTHNALLRLGDDRYLEVLAVNPRAPSPDRPRWFGLDRIAPDSPPRLATWVARSGDITSAAAASTMRLGDIEAMSRGDFSWLIAVSPDGKAHFGGMLPALIEWTGAHPARSLDDRGCSLAGLEAFHPSPLALVTALQSLGLRDAIRVHTLPFDEHPYLVAHIQTPGGLRTIGGPTA